jgi:WD40 repeat protein
MKQIPVLFLAFANDRNGPAGYLRNLPREINALKDLLDPPADAGLCEVELLTNATAEGIIATFQKPKFRGRIAWFHYSGHADSFDLLLEDREGGVETAHGRGLIPFLALQPGLQGVFINGCFSLSQARELSRLGLPVVIGTVKAVDDAVAADLSQAFYRGLAAGIGLEAAWQEAGLAVTTRHGDGKAKPYYRPAENQRGAGFEGPPGGDDRFPWEICYREGAEEVKNWNLPEAAANPLYGLPPLPSRYDLPAVPFRFLRRFERDEAGVFFGRGRYIRALYQRLALEGSSPVILLYGQSGVGKSSLLTAGLLPRLEDRFDTVYLRRDGEKGLSAALRETLESAGGNAAETPPAPREAALRQLEELKQTISAELHPSVDQLIRQARALPGTGPAAAVDLRAAWMAREKQTGKPFLFMLDQAEEAFTRPHPDQPRELEEFLEAVEYIFRDPEQRPKGKLVLSYRKEFSAEFEQALQRFHISHEHLYLERLSREDIIEVATGLESSPALQRKYQLSVEPGLPTVLADDLLADRESPITPVLQIILSKLWQLQEKEPHRVFRLADYQELAKKGILLTDFFQQQMAEIKAWEKILAREVESSGLALDILHYHTTSYGTAETRSLADLRELYQHQQDVLQALIQKFEELYLLSDSGREMTHLAHDALAPIVHKKIRESDKPGQRALRILEAKATDYEINPEKTILEEEDLELVEKGRNGMRLYRAKEQELIEKSRRHRARLQAERRRNRLIRRLAVAAVVLAAAVSTVLWRLAEHRRRSVETSNLYNEGRLTEASDPTRALAAIRSALGRKPADTTMRRGAYEVYARNLFYEELVLEKSGPLRHAAFSPDGRRMVTAVGDTSGVLWRYRPGQPGPYDSLTAAGARVNALVFKGPDTLFAGSEDRGVYRYVGDDPRPDLFEAPGSAGIRAVAAAGRRLAAADQAGQVSVWDTGAEGGEPVRIRPESAAGALALSPAADWLAVGQDDGRVTLYRPDGRRVADLPGTAGAEVRALAFAPSGGLLLAADADGWLRLWRQTGPERFTAAHARRIHEQAIRAAVFSTDGRFVLTGSADRTARLLDTLRLDQRFALLGHGGVVHSVGFHQGGDTLFTASDDGRLRRWPFPRPYPERQWDSRLTGLQQLAFSPDGRFLVMLSQESQVDVRDPFSGRSLGQFTQHQAEPSALALSAGSPVAASGDRSGSVHLWDINTRQTLGSGALDLGVEVAALAVSPNGQWVAAAGRDTATVWLWNRTQPSTQALRLEGSHRQPVTALAFSPDGKSLMTGGLDSLVVAWTVPDGKAGSRWKLPDEVAGLETSSPEARPVALGAGSSAFFLEKDGTNRPLPGEQLLRWKDGEGWYAAISARHGGVRTYTAEGYPLQVFQCDAGELQAIALHPSGDWLAGGTAEGKVLIWRIGRKPFD